MKHARLITLVFFAFASGSAQEKKPITFEQIFNNGEPRLTSSLPNITGWRDDDHYLLKKGSGGEEKEYAVDVVSGKEILHNDPYRHKELVGEGISVNQPASRAESSDRRIYVKENDLFFLDGKIGKFVRLTDNTTEEKNPTLSPDGKHVAFTRDNDLFSIDLETGVELRYTRDGSDVVYNGRAAWLYYEEIFGRPSRYKAFWWSPDSRRLAFYRFDEKDVPVFPLFDAEGQHGTLEETRYPKAGDNNPEVKFGVADVGTGNVAWGDFDGEADQYMGIPFWNKKGDRLITQWMNRQQDTLILYSIDLTNGKKIPVYLEHQPTWVEWMETMKFADDGKSFFIQSDKSGWIHIYHYGIDGKLIKQVTGGDWSVSNILHIDEKNELIYFTAKKESSTDTDLYSVNFDGGQMTRLTSGNYSHSVNLSPNGKYFITTYSNVATPTAVSLCDRRGKEIRKIADSKTESFGEYLIGETELFRVRTKDGYDLPVSWTLPVKFDGTKKYPVIISIYGGPNSAAVSNSWGGLKGQWLAKEGVIQVSVDHRGSGHFGKAGAALMYRQLGKWEMDDYIEVVKWLRGRAFVDSSRICITGGSYGGYVAALALTYGADYFPYGIASYSVVDYRLYDSHYTERYMDTPAENPEGYKNSSVLTWVDRYKGLLRIVHGTMDDNVHMQNILQLVNSLENSKKHFELMIYPGGRHGWGGAKATHLRNENYRFYYQYLLGKEFPENLFN